jgi:hypothetical protein
VRKVRAETQLDMKRDLGHTWDLAEMMGLRKRVEEGLAKTASTPRELQGDRAPSPHLLTKTDKIREELRMGAKGSRKRNLTRK